MSARHITFVCVLLAAASPACNERGERGRAPESADSPASVQSSERCEHGLPPGLCTKCNPALAAVFQAKGDWCEEHGFPESFCPICNPDAPIPDVGAAPAPVADWCAGHGLPESMCTKCNPSLVAKFRAAGDFCEQHGFPESVCPVCNPQTPPGGAGQPVADWCVEHGLPESKCTKCNPALVAQYRAAGDFCEEHGFPESVCPVCNPQQPPPGAEQAAIEARVVRFRAPDIEAAAGIQTAAADTGPSSAAIECTARIGFDADRVADIRAIVPGIVRRVRAELGAKVERGAPLFELESTRVGEIQGALQTARERVRTAEANLARQRELRASDIASARQVEVAAQELAGAHAEARTAEATLRMAGAAASTPSGRYTLTAPIAGTVVRRPAVIGLLATESASLATIADTSVMWALCEVLEAHAARVALGQRVVVTLDAGDDDPIAGEITWIAAEVDARTRTVTARAEVPNPRGHLRANQFARARIETGAPQPAVSVPRSAVQRVGEHEVVFVRTAQGVYEPRVVQRHGDGERVRVEGRVEAGDAVVTTGAVLLRTEIMPGSIGAGCCEVEPPGGD
ncbi:efflux RND transporter periplasmic adaptor subunit [Haliangium sp.]|uniref:efflux RND transporter periplasmic adaptor subunit n=1 Tax=Haliangium sp. TaxID=2663208 RepID=UPI003D148891